MAWGPLLFMVAFTLSSLGLNPSSEKPQSLALVSLLFQVVLFTLATHYAAGNQVLVTSLHHAYVINALSHVLIVRMFVPFALAWVLSQLYLLFPRPMNYLLMIAYRLLDSVLNITRVLQDNEISLALTTVGSVIGSMHEMSTGTLLYLSKKFRRDTPSGDPYESRITRWARQSAVSDLASMLGKRVQVMPLLSVIPSEILKYYTLTTAVKSYQQGNQNVRCQDVLLLAAVTSIPIASVQVVTSDFTGFPDADDSQAYFMCATCVVGTYAACMISCVMLGAAIAERSLLKRGHGTRKARVFSALLMGVVEVLTRMCSLRGILSMDVRVAGASTLLVTLLATGWLVRLRTRRLLDEQDVRERSRAESDWLTESWRITRETTM